MSLFEPLRKALLAGLGMQEKAKEVIEELVKKGELSETQGAKIIKEWSKDADKGLDEFGKAVSDGIAKALDKMPLATKKDVEELSARVKELTERIAGLETKGR